MYITYLVSKSVAKTHAVATMQQGPNKDRKIFARQCNNGFSVLKHNTGDNASAEVE